MTNSHILLRSCGGGITAWKGTNTTFPNKYGVYIVDSNVSRANNTLIDIVHTCPLGRPWNAQHRSVFAHTFLDDSILPAGYVAWSVTEPRVNYSEWFLAALLLAAVGGHAYHPSIVTDHVTDHKVCQIPPWPNTTPTDRATTQAHVRRAT